jgi:hypothetical protein
MGLQKKCKLEFFSKEQKLQRTKISKNKKVEDFFIMFDHLHRMILENTPIDDLI